MHELMGGKLHVYRRENSRHWQCSTYHRWQELARSTTKEDSLSASEGFRRRLVSRARGKARAGELKAERRSKPLRRSFDDEYQIITEGQRNAEYAKATGAA